MSTESMLASLIQQLLKNTAEFAMHDELKWFIKNISGPKELRLNTARSAWLRSFLSHRYWISFSDDGYNLYVCDIQKTEDFNASEIFDMAKSMTDMEVAHMDAPLADRLTILVKRGAVNLAAELYDLNSSTPLFTHIKMYWFDLLFNMISRRDGKFMCKEPNELQQICDLFKNALNRDPVFQCASNEATFCIVFFRNIQWIRSTCLSSCIGQIAGFNAALKNILKKEAATIYGQNKRILGAKFFRHSDVCVNGSVEEIYMMLHNNVSNRKNRFIAAGEFYDYLHMVMRCLSEKKPIYESPDDIISKNMDLTIVGARNMFKAYIGLHSIISYLRRGASSRTLLLVRHLYVLTFNFHSKKCALIDNPKATFYTILVTKDIESRNCYICMDELPMQTFGIKCIRCEDSLTHINCIKRAHRCGMCREKMF